MLEVYYRHLPIYSAYKYGNANRAARSSIEEHRRQASHFARTRLWRAACTVQASRGVKPVLRVPSSAAARRSALPGARNQATPPGDGFASGMAAIGACCERGATICERGKVARTAVRRLPMPKEPMATTGRWSARTSAARAMPPPASPQSHPAPAATLRTRPDTNSTPRSSANTCRHSDSPAGRFRLPGEHRSPDKPLRRPRCRCSAAAA